MGAAASIADWGPLPVDCSDVADVEAARAEVGRLRSLIGELAIISNLFSALDWERTGSLNAPNCVEWLRSAASSSRSAQTKLCAHTLQAGLGADAWDGDAVSYDRWLAFWKAEKADGDIVDTLAMFEQILYDVATSRLSLLFDALDIDNSGALAKPELVSFARSIAPAELERWGEFWKVVSAEADADRDGRIDRDEWMNFWSRQWFKCGRTDYPQFDATIAFFESIAVHAQNRRVEELFVYLDADGSGEITKKELIQWIMVLPPKYRFICVKLRKGMDTNGDGAITLAEWRTYWQDEREAGDIEEDIMWFKAIALRAVQGRGGDVTHLLPKRDSKWALPGKPMGRPHGQTRPAGVPPVEQVRGKELHARLAVNY